MTQPPPQAGWMGYAISAGVVLIVFALRWRRMRRERRLNINLLWIVPALLLVMAGALFWSAPPSPMVWAVCAVALAIGAGLGWQRGKFMDINVDPETHGVSQRGSPAALLFLLALIVIRTTAREVAAYSESWLHLGATTISDVLIAFALGLVVATRVEMYLRARRLIDLARRG
ncbi:CcdC protein domain-containing protein [Sphingomonas sp.]|uniref:CcdC protein domain-containing protein n=1 Tax=Sphingomonas sp. TaxID=28214 RepID=UPI001EC862A5|nr:CcdC protein domain-containing protein [Sphingomonas sp.]MBX3593108.1 DUF1453 family protein [Sphingomonas sp.]